MRLKEKDEHYNVIIKERNDLKNNIDKLLKELHEVYAKLEQLQNISSTIFDNNSTIISDADNNDASNDSKNNNSEANSDVLQQELTSKIQRILIMEMELDNIKNDMIDANEQQAKDEEINLLLRTIYKKKQQLKYDICMLDQDMLSIMSHDKHDIHEQVKHLEHNEKEYMMNKLNSPSVIRTEDYKKEINQISPISRNDDEDDDELIFYNSNTPRLHDDVNNSFDSIAVLNELANDDDQDSCYYNHDEHYDDNIDKVPKDAVISKDVNYNNDDNSFASSLCQELQSSLQALQSHDEYYYDNDIINNDANSEIMNNDASSDIMNTSVNTETIINKYQLPSSIIKKYQTK